MKTIAIFSSGTGGHVYPAYTLAKDYLAKNFNVIWFGTKDGIENQIIDKEKINILHIRAKGYRGKKVTEKILSVAYLGYGPVSIFIALCFFIDLRSIEFSETLI